MSLLSVLPKPSFTHEILSKKTEKKNKQKTKHNLPELCLNKNEFMPKTQSDFGDGGSFPEINQPQYPLGMGLKAGSHSSGVTPLHIGSRGQLCFTNILTQNDTTNKTVYSDADSTKESLIDSLHHYRKTTLTKPTKSTAKELTNMTQRSLENIVNGKIQAHWPRKRTTQKINLKPAMYIKLNSQISNPINESSRLVRLQTLAEDPLEPSKFRFRKQPPRAPSPPAPVLQSPPHKLSARENSKWKIPPCISNWKNVKSYTVPLDKRVAADGRGYESFTINSRFSELSTSLYEAENIARENVRLRGEQMHRIAEQKRVMKENELEKQARLAIKTTDDNGISNKLNTRKTENYQSKTNLNSDTKKTKIIEKPRYTNYLKDNAPSKNIKKNMEARRAREKLRNERLREQRREIRQEERKQKRGYAKRATERDIIERLALGEKMTGDGESMYDSRLFNTQSGLNSNFKDDYQLYDKPLFDSVSSNVYRPRNQNNIMEEVKHKKIKKDSNKEQKLSKPVDFIEE